jgi:hypothetical protein
MTGRGRRAALPSTDHSRPEYLSPDGLVVSHYNHAGRVKRYDFATLPVAEPMQRSLAALFAARCVPARWSAHATSTAIWFCVLGFAKFVAEQQHPPRDLDGLTVDLLKRWRQHTVKFSPYRVVHATMALLRDDPRLQSGLVADELLRRVKIPPSGTQSYSEAEFTQITRTAKQMFRSALQRIDRNAEHLRRWRNSEFIENSPDWIFGEMLDCLASTGAVTKYLYTSPRGRKQLASRYAAVLREKNVQTRWYLLVFPSRLEIAALGVLLMAEFGWNLSVIDRLRVPRASPDPGGHPTYRIELHKPRRGSRNHHETRNVTDDGASSAGRLISQALHATRFARALVETQAPGTDRLLVWHNSAPSRPRLDHDRQPPVGPLNFGITSAAALEWGQATGLSGSPFRRGRRTVVALNRRQPAQHSQNSHDRNYALVDKRVQHEAVEVIAGGAEDAAEHARKAVLHAELRNAPTLGDVAAATADCAGFDSGPYPRSDGSCGASFLMCLGCTNAHIHPGHHPRLAHLHHALSNLRSVIPPTTWATDWGDAHARLEHLKHSLGEPIWHQALSRVSADDRGLIDHLLTGHLDI